LVYLSVVYDIKQQGTDNTRLNQSLDSSATETQIYTKKIQTLYKETQNGFETVAAC